MAWVLFLKLTATLAAIGQLCKGTVFQKNKSLLYTAVSLESAQQINTSSIFTEHHVRASRTEFYPTNFPMAWPQSATND
eukprot:scaffold465883_cov46-Prasinocladus_malaysianus.AAC.1